jgi:nitrile hydratase
MNGVHDMGGMHGLGPLVRERDEPVFHERWEARAMALTVAAGGLKRWNIDASRHSREMLPAADYLRMSYYERWLAALHEMLLRSGLVTRSEIETGRPAQGAVKELSPLTAERVAVALVAGAPYRRELNTPARFKPGDRVRARNLNPAGHTRLPRYVRGHAGTVQRRHGAYVFPDSNAHGRGEDPRHLYSVRFEAPELWGDSAAGRGAVYADLWEPYLEPA